MLQSRAVPGQNRFLENTGCCRAEQFLDRIDSWNRRNAAEQSSSQMEYIPEIEGTLQSRADPGQNRFLEKTGCCRAKQLLDRIDSWKRQDAAELSSSWIEQIPGKDGMLQSKAVSTGQNRFLKKTECCRAEQCRQIDRLIAVIANYYIVDITLQKKLYSNISDMQY